MKDMSEAIKEVNIQFAKAMVDASIEATEAVYKELKDADLLNEQFVLDWLDKLNEISVRH